MKTPVLESVNIAKFLRTPFLQNIPGWLLLEVKSENISSGK